jgi:hypothetical protein
MHYQPPQGAEPLYIVIFRDDRAEHHLKDWAKRNGVDQRAVDNNRIKLYHQHTWDKFRTTWKQTWDRITVWDCWNKRHIELR